MLQDIVGKLVPGFTEGKMRLCKRISRCSVKIRLGGRPVLIFLPNPIHFSPELSGPRILACLVHVLTLRHYRYTLCWMNLTKCFPTLDCKSHGENLFVFRNWLQTTYTVHTAFTNFGNVDVNYINSYLTIFVLVLIFLFTAEERRRKVFYRSRGLPIPEKGEDSKCYGLHTLPN